MTKASLFDEAFKDPPRLLFWEASLPKTHHKPAGFLDILGILLNDVRFSKRLYARANGIISALKQAVFGISAIFLCHLFVHGCASDGEVAHAAVPLLQICTNQKKETRCEE